MLEGGLINWVKRKRLARVIKDIQQYQQQPYNLEPVPFIQQYLLSVRTRTAARSPLSARGAGGPHSLAPGRSTKC